jgi:hypothetical protein
MNDLFHSFILKYLTMKRYKLILLVTLLTLTTCGPDVKFTEPQPQGISNLTTIPKEYYGSFKSLTDSTIININSHSIVKDWQTTEYIRRDSLEKELKMKIRRDTSLKITDKLLLDKSSEYLLLNITLSKDSAKVKVKGSEVLFAVSDSQLVRSYKSFCFLNFKTKDNYWLVKTLRIKKNMLDFSDLIDSKEIEEIEKITKITSIKDTSNKVLEYRLSPSRKELRKILRRKNTDNNYKRI